MALCTPTDQVRLRRNRQGPLNYLRIPNGSDLQRELWAFVFFSEDQGDHHPGLCPPDLWLMVRKRDVKLPD